MVLLQSKLSGYYFKSFGVWASDPLDAMSFTDEWRARAFMRHERIDDVRVVEREVPELIAAA